MNTPFVSVHMIVKENTRIGEKFLDSCFNSLYEAGYPDEIVLIDNGSSDFVKDMYDTWGKNFKGIDCELKVNESDSKDFMSLRNQCLDKTNPKANFFHWIDSDEVYYPEDLDTLKNYLLPCRPDISLVWSFFYHAMINPFMIQDVCSKDNIFAYHKGLKWEGKVHEHVANLKPGITISNVDSKVHYVHLGYARQEWRTCLKWLHYDLIEHGHLNYYKVENVVEDGKTIQKPWFRDWRDPNNVLWDRRPICAPFPSVDGKITVIHLNDGKKLRTTYKDCKTYLPEGMGSIIGDCENEEDWLKRLDDLDGNDFWEQWQEKYKQMGTWADTLDWVVEEMTKINWEIV